MSTEQPKSYRASIIGAIALASIVSFGVGVMIAGSAERSDSSVCKINAEITTVNGDTTTNITAIGSKDSCADTVADAITSYTNQAAQAGDSPDDSAASDVDAASAPCAASQ